MTPRLSLEPDVASAPAARRWVRAELAGFSDELIETAGLLVTELVTNAILYTASTIEVGVECDERRVRVEIADHDPTMPEIKDYGLIATTGRGLRLVQSLASDWGVEAAAGGKVVWFDLMSGESQEAPSAAISLDDWPELTEPAPPPPRRWEGMELLSVRIIDLPLPILRQANEYSDALLREFRLISERDPSVTSISSRLLGLMEELTGRYTSLTAGAEAELAAALERGDAALTLTYHLPREAEEAVTRLNALFDEADQFCRAGDLLTLASSPAVAAFREWFLLEFPQQLRGEPPVPWPASSQAAALAATPA